MRVISQRTFGGPEVLEIVQAERPAPGPDEVLVGVRALGVNPADWVVREGWAPLFGDPPFVLGWDVSGVVEQVGDQVTEFQPGDEVCGMRRGGAYAEYVTFPARHVVRKPDSVDHIHAGATPAVALTAWQALVGIAGLQPGQRVLVHAAAGGVGHAAVQIAKARGAYVLGTARAEKHDFLRGLGVDEPIDYTRTDFAAVARAVDVVFDLVGGDYGPRSLKALRDGGLLVSAMIGNPGLTESAARAAGRHFAFVQVRPSGEDLAEIAALLADGRLRIHVEATFPFDQVAKAHALGATQRVTGKIVLTL
jgi:NADPH:quinone reductase-like Zn-dependent oxidoreductase